MRIAVITLFPEMFDAIREYGVSGRALSRGLIDLHCFNPRDFTSDRHNTVDDRPFGGGPGMVMKIEPLELALQAARNWLAAHGEERGQARVIYMSPQGRKLDQAGVQQLRLVDNLILIAGRYEGVDERFIETQVDEEWSIGDYVLSGGELPAMVMVDALARLMPGALGDAASAEQDSFVDGLLDCPHYTRPECYKGRSVPQVLISGDHRKIARWRRMQALGRTWERRPELLNMSNLAAEERALLEEYKALRKSPDAE